MRLIFVTLLIVYPYLLIAANLKGTVKDAQTGEELVGATVYLNEIKTGTISGLDGSYLIKAIPNGTYTITVRYISYEVIEEKITISSDKNNEKNFRLKPQSTEIEGVVVLSQAQGSSDAANRLRERVAPQVMNTIGSKSIELSPDINVANVVQRISGVTLDKGAAASGQYALIRGMDKRYNYTLVNGIKIPSTHNKHRYVSLDMFPSELVESIEVTKTTTPDMEGDGIGGAVNIIMKNAPSKFTVQGNIASGFSQFYAENSFQTFDNSVLSNKSPYERNEKGYNAVAEDFPTKNLKLNTINVPVNYFGNLTIGKRFIKDRLGWIISASVQNLFSGENNLYFSDDLSRDGKNLPVLTSMQERTYNDRKMNTGIHNKFDFRLNKNHTIELYSAYLAMSNTQVREIQSTNLTVSYSPETGNVNRSFSTRFRQNNQSLINFTLQGQHQLMENFKVKWSAVYSDAQNKTPDEATVKYENGLQNYKPVRQYVDFDGSPRIWRRNSDTDLAGYLNLNFTPTIFGTKTEIKAGGMYRKKERTSFYNKYTLNAIVYRNNQISYYSEKDIDWTTYDEILWKVYNPRGTIAVGENYDASEEVMAGYGMVIFNIRDLQVITGLRVENTNQGYHMQYPVGEPYPNGSQKYTDILPGLHLKYKLTQAQNLRMSYFRAINKPGFQEIVPYIDYSEDPPTAGNKNLKHAVADNFDLRWEFFPSPLDQVLAGLFVKNLKNPIEFAFDKFMNVSQNIVYTPVNADNAINYGFEADIIKFYREWGIKANYTYTHSVISSSKLSRQKDANGNDVTINVLQKRPLYGQSPHMANLSLLYKSTRNGVNAQLAFSYTGERIYTVSRYINNDLWQEGFFQLDLSAEKNFKNGITLFLKANNLLDSHLKVNIKNVNPMNDDVPYQDSSKDKTLVRDINSMATWQLGVKYKF